MTKRKRQQSKPVPAAPSVQFSGSEVDEIFPSKDPKSKGKNLRPYAGNTSCSWPNWGNLNTFPHFYLILQIPSLSKSSNLSFLQEFQATQTSKGRLKKLKDDITLLCSGSPCQAQSDVWTTVWQLDNWTSRRTARILNFFFPNKTYSWDVLWRSLWWSRNKPCRKQTYRSCPGACGNGGPFYAFRPGLCSLELTLVSERLVIARGLLF